MHRVRMSLPYFQQFDWKAEVVIVKEEYVDMVKDPLLLESIPKDIPIHKVNALSKKWTSKFGLGSLALRSMWYYRKKVNQLLQKDKYDLIYFSTTEFPICILGAYWKKKFNVPYVIDMQDPWFTDYYQKPKEQRPKKYWFSYRLHKFLEPKAMKKVSGLISVSTSYIETLQERYIKLKDKPTAVITFGVLDLDFKIAKANTEKLQLVYKKNNNPINLVYVGRGGFDMEGAVEIVFKNFKKSLENEPELFKNIHFHFIGTSYAPKGTGIATISPVAQKLGISSYVTEYTNRIGFYDSLYHLQSADGLIIIGSNDSAYTASKLYPYILADNQLLAIFHKLSSAAKILRLCDAGSLITFDQNEEESYLIFRDYIQKVIQNKQTSTNWKEFEPYTASFLCQKQVELFNQIV